jgi:NitT/TauT family transport system substrate-binding protein
MSKLSKRIGICSTLACVVLLAPNAGHTTVEFGKQGQPVKLVIGYQPYYTEAWSGVVINGKQLWKKYLPAGSTAEFQVGLQGAIIVNAMTGEKQHIGYVGDMPAIVATFRNLPDRGGTDIRIVATLGTSKQQCNIFLVRNEAPQFKNGREAVQWMAGKDTSSPHGSCTDRFARLAFKQAGIQPKTYLNQNIEVITTNFRAGKLDAAVIWEPTATKIAQGGLARRAASGEDFDALDGGFLIMLNDLITQRPDVHRAWLEAELEAQLFLADLNNAAEVSKLAEQQTEQMDRKVLWASLYGENPKNAGGGEVMVQLDYIVNERVQKLINEATEFLNGLPNKPAASPKVRDGAIDDRIAREVLEKRGLKSPVSVVKAQPLSAFK